MPSQLEKSRLLAHSTNDPCRSVDSKFALLRMKHSLAKTLVCAVPLELTRLPISSRVFHDATLAYRSACL